LRGPPETPYANGIYHGRITLPPTYPMRPPSFRFLSPSGRFEVNREICLSISDHHEDTWQPAWGVRTAVVALRGFMESEPGGQVGALECPESQRRLIAEQSRCWRCETCAKSNLEILKEGEEAAKAIGRVEDEIPKELKIGFKVKKEPDGTDTTTTTAESSLPVGPPPLPASQDQPAAVPEAPPAPLFPHLEPRLAQQVQMQAAPEETFWLDRLIFGLIAVLLAVVLKRFLGLPGVYY
jgi:ubiquitin-conjugating enzyme E2 J1